MAHDQKNRPQSTPHAVERAGEFARRKDRVAGLAAELAEELEALRRLFPGGHADDGLAAVLEQGGDRYELLPGVEPAVAGRLERAAWAALAAESGASDLMSYARRSRFRDGLAGGRLDLAGETGARPLPAFTAEGVREALDAFTRSADAALDEKIAETRGRLARAGVPAGLGGKVVIRDAVRSYDGRGRRLDYDGAGLLATLDCIFHSLDGRGPLADRTGPLREAADAAADDGEPRETDLFAVEAFANGGVHVRLKRPDLAAEFDRRAEAAGG